LELPESVTPSAPPAKPRVTPRLTAPLHDRHSARTDKPVVAALVGDTAVILASQALAFWVRFRSGWFAMDEASLTMQFGDYMRLITIGTVLLLVTFAHLRVYYARNLINLAEAATAMAKGATVWIFAFLAVSIALEIQPPISRLFVLLSYVNCILFLIPWRWSLSHVLQQEGNIRHFRRRVLFVGWNREADQMATAFAKDSHHLYETAGCVCGPKGDYFSQPPTDVLRLGSYTDLRTILERGEVDVVVLSDVRLVMEDVVALANLCETEYVNFKVVPGYFPMALTRLHLESVSGVPILGAVQEPVGKSFLESLKFAR
jgi:FlaA1/EpsC-like NDP-sugar epimerase